MIGARAQDGTRRLRRAVGAGLGRCAALLLAWGMTTVAGAQVRPVQLPNLPRLGVPAGLAGTVDTATDDVGAPTLLDARPLRVRQLLQTQSALIERDPHGNPILRAQILVFSPTPETLDKARAMGFVVLREQDLAGLNARMVVLRVPEHSSTRRAMEQMRLLDPSGIYDFNHIYLDSGSDLPVMVDDSVNSQAAQRKPADATGSNTAVSIKVGLIDGGVDGSHPVFSDAPIHRHGCDDKSVVSAHGTEVASLLVGHSSVFHGAAPNAELFAADVYCGLPTGGAVDAVIDAMAWLAHEQVPVINVSLVGPPNRLLESVVKLMIDRGHLIVAAVGNDGPAAPALYPAAYAGVVGVTAVDAQRRVLLEACRGPQVRFAAPGSDMAAASLSNAYVAVRGTSFAAPIVAGLLASAMGEPNAEAASKAVASLAQGALDLGARGFDPVYGYGLVGEALRTVPTAALLARPATSSH